MARIQAKITIAASPLDVFRFCHDVEKRPLWDERVKRVKLLSSGSVRSGTLIQVDAARGERYLYTWDGEYSRYQYPSSSTISVIDAAPSSPFSKGSESWQFDGVSEGTLVTVVWEYTPRNWIQSILDTFGKRLATGAAIRRSLANLKTLVEKK